MDISNEYGNFCKDHNIVFQIDSSISSYDETTLFCPAGMQQFKNKFKNPDKSTISNIQSCLRINDLNEIGNGFHSLYFNMMGLYSFDQKTLNWTIDFWMEFLNSINITPDYVTIHPDKKDWSKFYPNVDVRYDSECIWSDGDIGGYCTEFYKNGIEIGNIVNPLGNCIDVGFGKERLEYILSGKEKSKSDVLVETISKIINDGFVPSNTRHGYVLRKLLRMSYKDGILIDHPFYELEVQRQLKINDKWNNLKEKHKDKPSEWWFDTHGIDLSLMD